MDILSVSGLRKHYEEFSLDDLSFSLTPAVITGLIGRNGAGKTTTLKALLNLVHPDSGEVRFFGDDFSFRELGIKQKIGFVSGGVNFYPKKKLKTITGVTRKFYSDWDEQAYRNYLNLFSLNEKKTPEELSQGMKVKYSLALALSHRASLLILDEPTSGLDPVSRDDLLDIFLYLAQQQACTILFSTHIISDLEKCADHILYLKNGRLLGDDSLKGFLSRYRLLSFAPGCLPEYLQDKLIAMRRSKFEYTGLFLTKDLPASCPLPFRPATLEEIMIHLEKGKIQ